MEYTGIVDERMKARGRPNSRTAVWTVLALVAGVLAVTAGSAGAGNGGPSALGVQPVEVALGGQPNDCSASITGRLPSAADHELRIQNPQDGVTYQGQGGVSITLSVAGDDKEFDYVLSGPAVVFDVIVKGGQKSTHYDYDGNGGPGGATADQTLHAPTKGNGSNAFSISHVSFCYEDAFAASGAVFVDTNQNGSRDTGEGADAPRVITAYGPSTVSTTSAADGTFTLFLEAGGSYTICEEEISGFVQTAPAGAACTGLGTSEDGGHMVALIAAPVEGLDFGNSPVICGQFLPFSEGIFSGSFDLFTQGNAESPCDNKIGQLSVTGGQVNLPLTGSGSVAGIGIITKAVGSTAFEALEYAQSTTDSFEDLPWCVLRAKMTGDGDQFDPYLANDTMYPSLVGVMDAGTPAVASVSCKVHEVENAEGTQTTVVLIQDDPFWR